MRAPRAIVAVGCLAAALVPSGCGGGGDAAGTPDAGGGEFHPPTLRAACAAPTVAPGASLQPATGQRLVAPRLVWDGTQAAVAYAESRADGSFVVKLQRLTAAGQTSGAAAELGASSSMYGPSIAVAGNGTVDVVCWDDRGGDAAVHCASAAAAGSGAPTTGVTIAGASLPALALGDGGFALAYATTDGAGLQVLDGSAQAHGAAIPLATEVPTTLALVARSSGYAAALGGPGGLVLKRLDRSLATVGTTIPLAADFSASLVAAAASGDAIVAVWAEQTQVSSVTVAADGSVGAKMAVAPENIYSQVGAAAAASSFVTTWSSVGGHIGYRAVDGSGAPMGTPQSPLAVDWDDNPHTITGVVDGFLIASTVGSAGDTLAIAHLACP